jgi:hypothetical protein
MDKRHYFGESQEKRNERIIDKLKHRLGGIRKKISRGAANLYRIISIHKNNIFGQRNNKGHHKP